MNSRWLKLYRAYSISFNSSNVGKFLWSWILKDCIKVQGNKKNCCFVFPASTKREIRHFHVVVVATTAKKCTKKRDARAKLFLCQSKPIAFLPSSLTSPSSLLKLPIEGQKNSTHIELKLEKLFGATFWLPKTQPTTVCTRITGRTTRASYSSRLRFNATSSRRSVPGSTSRDLHLLTVEMDELMMSHWGV